MKTILKNQEMSQGTRNHHPKLFLLLAIIGMLYVGNTSAQHRGRHPAPPVATRGVVVTTMPRGGAWVTYGGSRYVYSAGVCYRPHKRGYVVVAPPFGFRIRVLPLGYTTIYVGGFPYYYYAGTYYVVKDEGYVVVQPPIGALVESVPKGGKEITIDGNTYYEVDGIQYQATMHNGTIWYKVIKVRS